MFIVFFTPSIKGNFPIIPFCSLFTLLFKPINPALNDFISISFIGYVTFQISNNIFYYPLILGLFEFGKKVFGNFFHNVPISCIRSGQYLFPPFNSLVIGFCLFLYCFHSLRIILYGQF